MKLAVLLFCAVGIAACRKEEEDRASVGPKSVKCEPVKATTVRDAIEVRGTVAPPLDRDAQLAPQVAGRLLRIEVREGDPVALGQVVARIDDAPLVDAANQAEAVLARTRAERQNAQTTLERIRRVFEHGIASRQEVDDAAAKEAAAKAAEAEADAVARQAHRQLERAIVHSPLKGVVLKVFRKPGELVDGTPGTPIVEVADTSELELVADVPAQDLVRLNPGSPATLTFSALPDREFKAQVYRVAPSVDRSTGVGTVRIALARTDGVRPPVGTFGIARVESGEPRQATLIPAVAIRSVTGTEGEVVLCGTDHRAHLRKVSPGPTHQGLTEVRGGALTATDRVAVEPVLGLADGDPIEEAK